MFMERNVQHDTIQHSKLMKKKKNKYLQTISMKQREHIIGLTIVHIFKIPSVVTSKLICQVYL